MIYKIHRSFPAPLHPLSCIVTWDLELTDMSSREKNVSDITTIEIWELKSYTACWTTESDSTGRSMKRCLKPCFLRWYKWTSVCKLTLCCYESVKNWSNIQGCTLFWGSVCIKPSSQFSLNVKKIMSCQLSEYLFIVLGVMMTPKKRWKFFDEGLASQAKTTSERT